MGVDASRFRTRVKTWLDRENRQAWKFLGANVQCEGNFHKRITATYHNWFPAAVFNPMPDMADARRIVDVRRAPGPPRETPPVCITCRRTLYIEEIATTQPGCPHVFCYKCAVDRLDYQSVECPSCSKGSDHKMIRAEGICPCCLRTTTPPEDVCPKKLLVMGKMDGCGHAACQDCRAAVKASTGCVPACPMCLRMKLKDKTCIKCWGRIQIVVPGTLPRCIDCSADAEQSRLRVEMYSAWLKMTAEGIHTFPNPMITEANNSELAAVMLQCRNYHARRAKWLALWYFHEDLPWFKSWVYNALGSWSESVMHGWRRHMRNIEHPMSNIPSAAQTVIRKDILRCVNNLVLPIQWEGKYITPSEMWLMEEIIYLLRIN
jgi:hypothetical protein